MTKENVVKCAAPNCGRSASCLVNGAAFCAACAAKMEGRKEAQIVSTPVHDRAEAIKHRHRT